MKNLDQQIIDEITRRVLEKDRELKQNEDFYSLKNSTVRSLAEMTSLSERELDVIKEEAHISAIENHHKNIKKQYFAIFGALTFLLIVSFIMLTESQSFWTLVLATLVSIFILFLSYANKTQKRIFIIDYFDNLENKWAVGESLKQERKFENDSYIIQTGTEDWCYWDNIKINPTTNFTVTAESKWISGSYGSYGIMLMDKDDNYISLELCANKTTRYFIKIKDEYDANTSWKHGFGTKDNYNNQHIEISGKTFKYFVNEKLAFENNLARLGEICKIGIRACDKLTVSFNYLQVRNSDTGEILFNDDFKKPNIQWTPIKDLEYIKAIENGKYSIQTYVPGWCYWSYRSVTIEGDCEFSLTARFIEGENADFGLSLYLNSKSYKFFKVNNLGIAAVDEYNGKEFVDINNKHETGYEFTNGSPVTFNIKIKKKRYTYYVNDFLVETGAFNVQHIFKIAVRVCGQQKISFEKLIIEEL